jgi:hypothetical protein
LQCEKVSKGLYIDFGNKGIVENKNKKKIYMMLRCHNITNVISLEEKTHSHDPIRTRTFSESSNPRMDIIRGCNLGVYL